MKAYNVEALLPPIASDNDWDEIRDLIDVIPGTLLVEDPEAPMFIFPVDARDDYAAFSLVDGFLRLRGVEPVRGRICLVEDDEVNEDHDDCKADRDWDHLVCR